MSYANFADNYVKILSHMTFISDVNKIKGVDDLFYFVTNESNCSIYNNGLKINDIIMRAFSIFNPYRDTCGAVNFDLKSYADDFPNIKAELIPKLENYKNELSLLILKILTLDISTHLKDLDNKQKEYLNLQTRINEQKEKITDFTLHSPKDYMYLISLQKDLNILSDEVNKLQKIYDETAELYERKTQINVILCNLHILLSSLATVA
jgi:hypothetical protein